jgi:CheY-like chemotaxis protein
MNKAVTVMVVDDNAGITRALRQLLGRLGCEAVEYTNPLLAWDDFQKDPDRFDLVFTDQNMPEMSGQALLAKVRELRPEQPIILGSGDPIESQPDNCPVLQKPYLGSTLSAALKQLFSQNGG